MGNPHHHPTDGRNVDPCATPRGVQRRVGPPFSLVVPIGETLRQALHTDGDVLIDLMADVLDEHIGTGLAVKTDRGRTSELLDCILMMISLELNENIVASSCVQTICSSPPSPIMVMGECA